MEKPANAAERARIAAAGCRGPLPARSLRPAGDRRARVCARRDRRDHELRLTMTSCAGFHGASWTWCWIARPPARRVRIRSRPDCSGASARWPRRGGRGAALADVLARVSFGADVAEVALHGGDSGESELVPGIQQYARSIPLAKALDRRHAAGLGDGRCAAAAGPRSAASGDSCRAGTPPIR